MFETNIYQNRRAVLKKKLKDGLILFPGNEEASMNYKQNTYPFRQDSTFLYYFGIDIPDMHGLIDVDSGEEIIFGIGQKQEVMPLKMEVHTIEGFTGHSGRRELMNFTYRCNPKPKKVIINHGENSRCLDLASSIHKQFRVETSAPRNLEAVRLK